MAGLFDAIWNDPSGQALTALGAGLLGVRRGNEGRAIYGALDAYNQAQQEQRRNELVQLQRKMTEFQLAQAQRRAKGEEREEAFYADPSNFMSRGQSAFPPNEMDPEGSPAAPPGLLPPQMIGQRMIESGLAKQGIPLMQKPVEDTVALSPGSVLVGKQTGKQVASAPAATADDPITKLRIQRDKFPPGSEPWKLYNAALIKATTHAPAAIQNNFAGGEKGYKHSRDLATDFQKEPIYKAHTEVTSAYRQIVQGLDAQSPAGDLTAATKFMKILDPGSVVRESELQMAMQATGLGDRIANYVQMVMSGNKLTPQQRRDFRNVATRLYEESEKLYRTKQKTYQGIAQKYDLDASMLDLGTPTAPVPQSVDDLVDLYTQDK